MAQRSGRNTIVGLSKGTTWGTAVNLAALDGIIPRSIDKLVLDGDVIPDKGVANLGEIQYMDVIKHTVNPTITLDLRRTGMLWRFWAHLMGDDTVTGADPYTHTFNWQDESALFSCMGIEINNADIIEWPSLKTVQISLEPGGEGFAQMVVNTIGDTIAIADDATNTGTQFDLVTYGSKTLRMPSRELRLRINTQGGGALDSGDTVGNCSNWNLLINPSYEEELVTQGASTGVEYTTDEPQRSDFAENILGFDTTDYTTIALLDDFHDETEYKADLYWAKTIGTAFSFLIECGALHPIPAAVALEAGARIPLTRNFQLIEPQSTPTGMATANIIHSILVNDLNASYE